MLQLVLLSILLSSSVVSQNFQFISVTDPNWYFTEWNWCIDRISSSPYAQSANPGAYFKVGFTGTSVSLLLNTSTNPSFSFTILRYSIDLAPYQEITLPISSSQTDEQWLTLGSNLQNGNHEIILFIKSSLQSQDRWLYGPVDRVRIEALGLDIGATTLPPTLRPKRMLVYWDSIGEGVEVLGGGSGDLADNDGTSTWAMALATALLSEISVVAFGRQGYTIPGNGNVPPLITPGNDALSAWNKFDVDHYRFEPNQTSTIQPDYIFNGHGTNDALSGNADVTVNAVEWLFAIRAANPSSKIFLVIPFGGFPLQSSNLQQAMETYQQKTNDQNAFLLDLGVEATIGLSGWVSGGTYCSYDGIHPLWFRTGQLGALLATASIQASL